MMGLLGIEFCLAVVVEGDVSFDMGNYRRMILRFCIRL